MSGHRLAKGQPVSDVRNRLYEAYATGHAGLSDDRASELAFRRDILPHLPSNRAADVVDLGCGQGHLVRLLLAHGYPNSRGIDISPEQVALAHAAGVSQVELGDFRSCFRGAALDAVTATDFFEHLTKEEILDAFDHTRAALRAGGVLILRVPNAVSPFGGNYRYGDLTHETSFTARSLHQLGVAAGFSRVEVSECRPNVHGVKSLGRSMAWKGISLGMKLALAAETGVVRGHAVTQNIVAVARV